MSQVVSTYIVYNFTSKQYIIRKKKCLLNAQSAFGKSIGSSSSINTSTKATLSQLNEYYDGCGTHGCRKYKKININIAYGTIEEIIAASKVFILAHKQNPIETMSADNGWKTSEKISAEDIKKYTSFVSAYKYPNCTQSTPSYSPFTPLRSNNPSNQKENIPSQRNTNRKRRKLNDTQAQNSTTESHWIVDIVTNVLEALLLPIYNKIISLFDLSKQNNVIIEQNNCMLTNICDLVDPNIERTHSKYRKFQLMHTTQLVDHFIDREKKLDRIIIQSKSKICNLRKLKDCYRKKLNRRTKTLNKMRSYIGQSKIVDLKVNINVKHQRFRDENIKQLILSCQKLPGGSTKEWEEFIWRQYDILSRKNAEFHEKAVQKTFKDVINIVNKNTRNRELSIDESKRWVVLKICAGLSVSKHQIVHGQNKWDKYHDKNGKICYKRKIHDDGTMASFGCSRYMMDRGMVEIIKEYPEFDYTNIFRDNVYHSSLVRLLLIYLSILCVAGDMQQCFLLSEKNVQHRFQSQLENLPDGQRLELDFGTFRGLDMIDGTPLKNVSFGSGTNWLYMFDDLFESGWEGASLRSIHHAFSTVKDASDTTVAFNDTVLEHDFMLLSSEGIILSYPNLPIDAKLRFDTMFQGDMPLMACLKQVIQHNGDFGSISDTCILFKDESSLKHSTWNDTQWNYDLTPKWMYKNKYLQMADYERYDNWREMDYNALPDVFMAHLTYDIHEYANDKIDHYMITNPEYDINNIDHRKQVSKILEFAVYNRCNKRALWYNFEWLHGSTGITSGLCDYVIDDCRNTIKIDNKSIIAGSSQVGHSNFKKQTKTGLKEVPKHKKIGYHFNGNIAKRVVLTIWHFIVYLMCYACTLREVYLLICYVVIFECWSYVLWGALWGISNSEISSDIILDNMEAKVNMMWNALNIYPRLQTRIPYLIRLKIEAIPQLRLYHNDPLNIHKRGAESNTAQTIEREQSVVKNLFCNHMNKSDEQKGIQTIFKYLHCRNALGVKYAIWNIRHKSDSSHWKDDDLFEACDASLFEIGDHVQLPDNSNIETLFNAVKDSMKTGVPPPCYVVNDNDENSEIKSDCDENSEVFVDDEQELHVLDGLQVRSIDELVNHLEGNEINDALGNESDSDDSDDDDDDYLDPAFD